MPTALDEIVMDAADPRSLGRWWAALLDWDVDAADDQEVSVTPPPGEPGLELLFCAHPDPRPESQRLHLDVRSRTTAEQAELVARAERSGGRRIDIGQGDVPWVVLADPEDNHFCVLEPRDVYAAAGSLAAVVVQTLDPRSQARFWARATGWGVSASEPTLASVVAPGGVGPALEFLAVPKLPAGKNRLHLDVRPLAGGDRDAEVARLIGLGARPLDVGQGRAAPGEVSWTVLADPEGAAFCVLSAPPPPPPP
jgi:hypothetical protein